VSGIAARRRRIIMNELNIVQQVAVWALPVLFAITVHEVAHGWVAQRLGDPTAMMLGRLTLNPIKHIDPVGTVVVPLLLLFMGGFIFGWAKPVPITWENLKHPKRDMILVAAAGPLSNLCMAILWAGVMKTALVLPTTHATQSLVLAMFYMGSAGITINIVLMVLNLLPLPPLDGGRVVSGLLPDPMSWQFNRIEPYGFLVLLVLLATGILGYIMSPPIHELHQMLFRLFRL
jgi:Zn-dependent protease